MADKFLYLWLTRKSSEQLQKMTPPDQECVNRLQEIIDEYFWEWVDTNEDGDESECSHKTLVVSELDPNKYFCKYCGKVFRFEQREVLDDEVPF